jgi:hypothetical protein
MAKFVGYLTNPDDVDITIQITMSLAGWKALTAALIQTKVLLYEVRMLSRGIRDSLNPIQEKSEAVVKLETDK